MSSHPPTSTDRLAAVDGTGLLNRIAKGPRWRTGDPETCTLALAPGHTLTVDFVPMHPNRVVFTAECTCGWFPDLTLTRWHLRAQSLTDHVAAVADPDLAAEFAAAAFLASLVAAPPFRMDR